MPKIGYCKYLIIVGLDFNSSPGRKIQDSIYKETGRSDFDITDDKLIGFSKLAHINKYYRYLFNRVQGFDMGKFESREYRRKRLNKII